MNPKLRNLIWQELRQRRTQFLVCFAWMLGRAVFCLAIEWRWGPQPVDINRFGSFEIYSVLVPIFLAMRTSLGEVTDQTRSFSDGLPISPRWRGGVRLAGGASVLIVPIALATAVQSVGIALLGNVKTELPIADGAAGLPDPANLIALSAQAELWYFAAQVAFAGLCLYLILSLLGTTLRAESHLGYCGAAISLLWFVGFALGHAVAWRDQPTLAALIGAVAPQATIASYSFHRAHAAGAYFFIYSAVVVPLLASAAIQFGLAAMFVRRYSRRLAVRTTERRRVWRRPVWWRPWLPTRGIALAWLAWRDAVPMCLPGLAIACLLTFFSLDSHQLSRDEAREAARLEEAAQMLDWQPGDVIVIESGPAIELPAEVPVELSSEAQPVRRPLSMPRRLKVAWLRYAASMSSAMWFVGILWSVMVGAGLFSAEFDWRTGEFWRTRPISAGQLFGVKFIAGLFAVLLVLDGTVIAAAWNSPDWGDRDSMNWPYMACIVPLHATMFAIAVACSCLLRRSVAGGMAAMMLLFFWVALGSMARVAGEFDFIEIFNNLTARDDASFELAMARYPFVASAMGLILVASIVIGWRALRRYDPRRQTG